MSKVRIRQALPLVRTPLVQDFFIFSSGVNLIRNFSMTHGEQTRLILYGQLFVVGTLSICLLILTTCVAYAALSNRITVEALGNTTGVAAGTGLSGFAIVLIRPLREFLSAGRKWSK